MWAFRYGVLGVSLATLAAAVGLGSCASAAPPNSTVILYGDSLAQQAAPAFNFFGQLSHKVSIANRLYSTSAPCDWITRASQDAATMKPEAVVLMFGGSTLSACMAGYNASSAPLAVTFKYERDLRTLAAKFGRQTELYIELIPARPPTTPDLQTEVVDLNTMYRTLGMTVENAAADVENPDGSWAQALPCWSTETVCGTAGPGMNTVRAPLPDGFHFCPYVGSGTCSTYSSGAVRFGLGMEEPVGLDFHF